MLLLPLPGFKQRLSLIVLRQIVLKSRDGHFFVNNNNHNNNVSQCEQLLLTFSCSILKTIEVNQEPD